MKVIVRSDQPLVQVGDRLLEGWLTEPACPGCGGPGVYYLAFDATCCPTCNVWLELRCPEPDCDHCRIRPERPFGA